MTFMSNQFLNEAGLFGPVIKVDNQGTESEISSTCQRTCSWGETGTSFSPLYFVSVSRKWTQSFKQKEFAMNDVFDFAPSDLQKGRPQFSLLNGFSVYPPGYLLSPSNSFYKREKNEQNVSPRMI